MSLILSVSSASKNSSSLSSDSSKNSVKVESIGTGGGANVGGEILLVVEAAADASVRMLNFSCNALCCCNALSSSFSCSCSTAGISCGVNTTGSDGISTFFLGKLAVSLCLAKEAAEFSLMGFSISFGSMRK